MAHIKIIYPDTSEIRRLTDAQPKDAPDYYWDVAHHGKDVSSVFPEQYAVVHECEMDGDNILSSLWEQFNIGDRGGLRIRSMSVGDIVEIDGVRWVCQPVGWAKVAA